MDELQAVAKIFRQHLALTVILENLIVGQTLYYLIAYTNLHLYLDFSIAAAVAIFLIILISLFMVSYVLQPLSALRQAILHLSPSGIDPVKAPDIKHLKIGQQLVTNLTGQVYEIARVSHQLDNKTEQNVFSRDFIANALPLPLFILNDKEEIKFVNEAAAKYVGIEASEMIGKNVYMLLDMAFPSEDTFDKWLKGVKHNTATATASWERVRLTVRDNHPTVLFDLAAYYNQGNPEGNTTLLVLFDHTKQYSQDDQAVSFVALSVHELRTPLTLLRGYVEVFEQELRGKVTPELEDFLDKLRASCEQLTAFVNNILNVARVDDDQLELTLMPEDWVDVLTKSVENNQLRAKVRGIKLELSLANNLPKVGVDRLSVQEVINNLIDNAIKYSGSSKSIKIDSQLNSEGLVETTIQDFGVGIPTSIVPNLFTKFYRDHRNRSQIGGTGLGLYLSKAIISAHGGNLWVRSKEGKGSTFGFTLIPYEQLSKDKKASGDQEIIRSAHGWIKNHSYYRR